MTHREQYLIYQEDLWMKFQDLVRVGATFPTLLDVTYPPSINPPELILDTDGRSNFLAKELVADPKYKLRPDIGDKDIIVEFSYVKYH